MDVTFFESQPYFSSSQIPLQGEIEDKVVSCEDENEEEIWVFSSIIQSKVPEAKSVSVDGNVKSKKKDKQLLVYERKRLKDKVTATLPPQSLSPVEGSGNPHPIILESTDLDAPIAIRKGVRSCTKHPISNFVSYTRLSPNYRAYISKISSLSIPNHV